MPPDAFAPQRTNPFSPDFGQPPEHLVGRDRLLKALGSGLSSGPRSPAYTSLLLGPRGSGKTVILSEMEDRAAANGWIVMSLDGGTSGLPDRIRQSVVHARDEHDSAEAADPDANRPRPWSGIRVGPFSLHRSVFSELRPEWDMRHLLAKLAEHAQRVGSSVLLTIDELHSGDRTELRRLSGDLQHITKRGQLPLALVAAGLSEMKHTLLMDKQMTFFRRCSRFDMPALETADAMAGLRLPVLDAGGTFEPDALLKAAQSCGPLPYSMQLIGYNAWAIAGAPDRAIDGASVDAAVKLADDKMIEDLVEPAWHDLADSSRNYLMAVADLGDSADRHAVATRLTESRQTLVNAERRLRACGFIEVDSAGIVRLTELMPVTAIASFAAEAHGYDTEAGSACQSSGENSALGSAASRGRCGAYMPRAAAHCVLPNGHKGGHRSGKRHRD